MTTPTSQPTRKRVVHQLDTPFSTVSWPAVSPEDQDTILELLCDGQRANVQLGRKKDDKKAAGTTEEPPVPPMPEIDASIDVGLNSITRNLQALSQSDEEAAQGKPERQYLMIFVARGNQASTFNCHFPQMAAAASKSLPSPDKIRLVGFSNPCSDRLSACLGVPRVSSIAIAKDAPGAGALQEFVLKSVPPAEAAWLDASRDAQHLTTKINAIETTVGPKRPKMNETTS
ncbi:hypothetical protein CEP52_006671 [Fusarium oligoseptatum]|uniref:Rnase subunit pop3 n=1 Tax=Fusarium oligoseptatum TaxID=2604345 RepID=A0A428TRK3_9HYPO|nr:hypothetical protein CEP52_006671 [Fusarium oligoseptatum]